MMIAIADVMRAALAGGINIAGMRLQKLAPDSFEAQILPSHVKSALQHLEVIGLGSQGGHSRMFAKYLPVSSK